jgi:hypothetical protein
VRAIFRAVSIVLLVVGVLAAALAMFALAVSWIVPPQPPPSMNEGHGMANAIGWMLLIPGAVAIAVGIAVHHGLNAAARPGDVAWAREHRRLW